MNIETEAKIRVDGFDEIRRRLRQNEAVFLRDVEETDIYFDDSDKRLLARQSGLRLRRENGKDGPRALLTFKGPRQESAYKSRRELQTYLSNYEQMRLILDALGYVPLIEVEKHRQLWQLNRCQVCLDDVPPLGRFVEVEGPGDAEIGEVLRLLGLDAQEHIHSGYARMLAEFRGQVVSDREDKNEGTK